jgi:hypothetical protein
MANISLDTIAIPGTERSCADGVENQGGPVRRISHGPQAHN